MFKKDIVVAIDEIIVLLKKVQLNAEKCLMDKQTEESLQELLVELSNILRAFEDVLVWILL